MNPVGELSLAARQLATHGTHVVGWAASSAYAALGALSYGVRTLARPASARGVALEAGALAMHLVMYPWGALAEQLHPGGPYNCYRTDDLHPSKRGLVIADMRAAGTPILLVHGFADNRSVFAVLRRALRKRGFGVVYGLNYSVLTGDVRSAARELGREVERICEATSAEQVHVVGHSLGGLIARYYVQRLGGDAQVHTLVTLGTPHKGTMAAYLLPTAVLRQLRPDSDVVAELAAPSAGCRTRFVAVWSELDEFIVPQRHARLDHPDLLVTNYQLSDVGHFALPVDSRAMYTVANTLAQLDEGPSADLTADVAAVGPSPTSAS
ncbi:MAG TPA: alpha/beta fold hydrolase [Pseudonocardiaceae bacterium]|jgi:pimeloyl-ACP methyl ester carboxylesterase|nr:alpha/beta fold hydrolase [Pseudonocardiaceae bacterium]